MSKIKKSYLWVAVYIVALDLIWWPLAKGHIFKLLGLTVSTEAFMQELMCTAFLIAVIVVISFIVSLVLLVPEIKNNHSSIEFVAKLNKISLGVKLGTIPFFVLHLMGVATFTAAFGNPFLLAFMPIVPVLGFGASTIALATTSTFSIITYVMSKKNGIISNRCFVILVLTQFIFIIDVIFALIGAVKIRKEIKRVEVAN